MRNVAVIGFERSPIVRPKPLNGTAEPTLHEPSDRGFERELSKRLAMVARTESQAAGIITSSPSRGIPLGDHGEHQPDEG